MPSRYYLGRSHWLIDWLAGLDRFNLVCLHVLQVQFWTVTAFQSLRRTKTSFTGQTTSTSVSSWTFIRASSSSSTATTSRGTSCRNSACDWIRRFRFRPILTRASARRSVYQLVQLFLWPRVYAQIEQSWKAWYLIWIHERMATVSISSLLADQYSSGVRRSSHGKQTNMAERK